MGSQCSSNINEQYQVIRTFQHPTLGQLKLIRNIKMHKNTQVSQNSLLNSFNIRKQNSNIVNGNSSIDLKSNSMTDLNYIQSSQLTNNLSNNANVSNSNITSINAVHLKNTAHTPNHNNFQSKEGELIAVKYLGFKSQKQLNQYIVFVKESNLYYNIPTLLKIMSYQVTMNNGSAGPQISSGFSNIRGYRCENTYGINVYFKYFNSTLEQVLRDKRKQLQYYSHQIHHNLSGTHAKNQKKIHKNNSCLLPKNLKLNNYRMIDSLQPFQRKICNIYYQQVEILRMIDHIVGALYFLNHLQHKHEAVCPENIMIDDEGKFVLIDAILFQLGTNYEQAFRYIHGQNIRKGLASQHSKQHNQKSGNMYNLKYLAPELLSHLKNGDTQHRQNTQKVQVFSVGLMALDMCLIQYNILEQNISYSSTSSTNSNFQIYSNFQIIDRKNTRINKTQLTKALIQTQSRYSLQLVDLLSCMLEYDPQKRINFSLLIDMLSPLLSENLVQIQRLYSQDGGRQHKNNTRNSQRQSQQFNKIRIQDEGNYQQSHMVGSNLDMNNNKNNTNISNIINLNGQLQSYQLMNKLNQLQMNFQKIMNRTVLYEQSAASFMVSSERQDSNKNRNNNIINNNAQIINKNNMNPPSHGNIKLNIGKKNNNSINVNAQPNNNKESKLLAEKLQTITSSNGYFNTNSINSNNNSTANLNLNINQKSIIQDQKRIINELKKIRLVPKQKMKSIHQNLNDQSHQQYTKHKQLMRNDGDVHIKHHNPNSQMNSSDQGTDSKLQHRINQDKRQVKGSQLYDLYLSEYQTIKKNRFR